jgi:epoxide hydrolase-like predicted phosphatase
MVRGIIFDFGGVFNAAHETLEGFAVASQRYGYSAEALYDLFYSGPAWQAAKLGRMASADYWREMMRALNLDAAGDIQAFRAELFAGQLLEADVVALAEQLHRRYPLALLSNALDDLESDLEQFAVRHLFQVVVNSATAGVAKPDMRAYQLALDGLGLQPHEALFIDDKPRNIEAAEALGIPSLLFTTAASLRAELQARGLLD